MPQTGGVACRRRRTGRIELWIERGKGIVRGQEKERVRRIIKLRWRVELLVHVSRDSNGPQMVEIAVVALASPAHLLKEPSQILIRRERGIIELTLELGDGLWIHVWCRWRCRRRRWHRARIVGWPTANCADRGAY